MDKSKDNNSRIALSNNKEENVDSLLMAKKIHENSSNLEETNEGHKDIGEEKVVPTIDQLCRDKGLLRRLERSGCGRRWSG